MKIFKHDIPPAIHFGHASSVVESNNSNAYLVFPELAVPDKEVKIGDGRRWYVLFAESPLETEHRSMSAQLAVEAMYHHLIENKSEKSSLRYTLESALCHANSTLRRIAQSEEKLNNFHTSALGACISSNRLYFTYVGDIHACLFRNKDIYQLKHIDSVKHQRSVIGGHQMTREIRPANDIDSDIQLLGTDAIPMVKHISFNIVNTFTNTNNSYSKNVMDYLLLQPEDLIVLCSSSVIRALDQLQIQEIVNALPTQLAAEEILRLATRQEPDQNHTAVVLRRNIVLNMDEYLVSHRRETDLAIA